MSTGVPITKKHSVLVEVEYVSGRQRDSFNIMKTASTAEILNNKNIILPSLSDYVEAIKDHFDVDVEARGTLSSMEFRPVLGSTNRTIFSIKVLRTEEDLTFTKVTKI